MSGPGLRYNLIDANHLFDALENEWTELLADSAADPLFCSFPWMRTWWRFYSHLGELRIAAVRDEERLLGLAPLFLRRMTAREMEVEMVGRRRFIVPTEGLRYKVLMPLGSGEVCSDFLGFIARRGREDEIWSGLFAFLCDKVRGFDILFLTEVNEEAPGFEGLQYAGLGRRNSRYCFAYNAPYTPLPGGYDEYLDTLSKKSRYNARKKLKQISILHKVEHRFHEDPKTLDAAMDAFYELHTERWMADEEPGSFHTPPMRNFHKAMAREGLRRGWLRLGAMTLDGGPPVFVTYAYQAGERVYLYQQGGSPDYPQFNLGYAALAFALQDACEHGARSYDFLRGEQDYKLHWAPQTRRLVKYLAGRTLKSSQFFARSFINTDPRLRQSLKRLLTRVRP